MAQICLSGVLMNDLEFKTRDIEECVLDTMENIFFSILWKTDISEPRWEKVLFVFKSSTLWQSKYFPNKVQFSGNFRWHSEKKAPLCEMHRAQSKSAWKSGTSCLCHFHPLLQVSILLRTSQVGCRHWTLLGEGNGAAEREQPPQKGSVLPIICNHSESLLMLQD